LNQNRSALFISNTMKIQFNTDHNISGTEDLRISFEAILVKELSRYVPQLNFIEVHLTDIDGNKEGQVDKRCLLEARLEGLNSMVVTNFANSNIGAVEGAIEKLKASLDTVIGKLENRRS
jgi:hypothetical protein